MKNMRSVALAVSSLIAVLTPLALSAADEDLRGDCQQAVSDLLKTDPGLQKFMDNSAGFAVFPNVGKGGLIVGGAHGKGCVYEKTNFVGHVTMTQASVGAQVGGQTFAEIIFFETPAAL